MRQLLSEKAMLVALEVHTWSARCHDKDVNKETAERYNADIDMLSTTKRLAPREALAAIRELRAEIKRFHAENTLPWDDRFRRILLAKNFDNYSMKLREFQARWEPLVRDFVAGYPAVIEDARSRLNGLFKEDDYPKPGRITEWFDVRTEIIPLPEAEDFRVSLQGDEVARIRDQILDRQKNLIKEAMADVWGRLFSQVQRMAERFKEDAPLRYDYVTDLKGLLDLLPRLNLTEDPVLEKMRIDAELQLCGRPIDDFRKDADARAETAAAAQQIMDAMAAYMGTEGTN